MRRCEPLAECTQGGVRSRWHQGLHQREAAAIHCGRMAPTMGLRRDPARFPVVWEEPADNAHTDAKGGGQWPHRAFRVFIGLDDPHASSRRVGSHGPLLYRLHPEPLPPFGVQCK
jgi:hypothetical protein